MRISILKIIFLIFIGFVIKNNDATSEESNEDLIFSGKITSIQLSPSSESFLNYIVIMHINQIIKGDFRGKQFNFRVHSPSRSELEMAHTYIVKAKSSPDGYIVDTLNNQAIH